jgi:hypothetical protein
MRVVLVVVILVAALAQAGFDWQATIGHGYAYRLTTIGGLVAAAWPETFNHAVHAMQGSGVPFLWDPVGALVMSLPIVLVLLVLAGVVWVTRGPVPRRY